MPVLLEGFCVRCGCASVCREGRAAAGRTDSRTGASPGRGLDKSEPGERVVLFESLCTSLYFSERELSHTSESNLWPEVERRQDVLVLCPWRSPWVVQLETLVAEVGPAVRAAFGRLQGVRRFTELAHHSHTAQTHCVSVPGGGVEERTDHKLKRLLRSACEQVGVDL